MNRISRWPSTSRMAALVLALLALGALASLTSAASAASGSKSIELNVDDALANPQQVNAQLDAAGLKAEVFIVPVSASSVGTWTVIAEVAGLGCSTAEETTRLHRVGFTPKTLTLPVSALRESSGRFVFYAGRAAQAGEQPLNGLPRSGPGMPAVPNVGDPSPCDSAQTGGLAAHTAAAKHRHGKRASRHGKRPSRAARSHSSQR
jgi:hypothetical protein